MNFIDQFKNENLVRIGNAAIHIDLINKNKAYSRKLCFYYTPYDQFLSKLKEGEFNFYLSKEVNPYRDHTYTVRFYGENLLKRICILDMFALNMLLKHLNPCELLSLDLRVFNRGDYWGVVGFLKEEIIFVQFSEYLVITLTPEKDTAPEDFKHYYMIQAEKEAEPEDFKHYYMIQAEKEAEPKANKHASDVQERIVMSTLRDFMKKKNQIIQEHTGMILIPEQDKNFILNLSYADKLDILIRLKETFDSKKDIYDANICPHCIYYRSSCKECIYSMNNGVCRNLIDDFNRYGLVLERLKSKHNINRVNEIPGILDILSHIVYEGVGRLFLNDPFNPSPKYALKNFMKVKNQFVYEKTLITLIPEQDMDFILNLPEKEQYHICKELIINLRSKNADIYDATICPHCIHSQQCVCSNCTYGENNGRCSATYSLYRVIRERLEGRKINLIPGIKEALLKTLQGVKFP